MRGDGEGIFRVYEMVDLIRRDLDWEAHEFSRFFVEDELGVMWFEGMDFYTCGVEGGDVFDVVKVLVGEEEVGSAEVELSEVLCDAERGVDDEAGAIFLSEDVAVGLNDAACVVV